MFRPGPERIPPGTMPNGVVVRVYDRRGNVLVEQRIQIGDDVEAFAEIAFEQASGHGDMCLVGYDGDSGERFTEMDWYVDRS